MDIKLLQGVMYFGLIVFLTVVLYGYIFHLYRSEKRGERDYEKYGRMALDDELTSTPVEPIEEERKKESP
ncbi:MAG: cytochrome c oxidase, cbb3-type, CcoQ subunit [Nitratiruptor sp.]|nr:cytochrome c oxidase, cbb3-type, CcoQ subunit [Nitratiruptor sp.]NPA83857.1 cytochrome c oxidase, cbb3-type, CcoQ subunit [Campylobacterota bacterium]